MMEKKCNACGAPVSGRKCEYCGERVRKSINTLHHSESPSSEAPTMANEQGDTFNPANGNSRHLKNNNSEGYKSILVASIAIFSLIVVGFFLLLRPLSSPNLDAFELFERSIENLDSIDSIILELEAQVEMATIGMDMEIPITGQISLANTGMVIEIEVGIMSFYEYMDIYIRDGYIYTDISGVRDREYMDLGFLFGEINELEGPIATTRDIDFSRPYDDSVTGYAERIDTGYLLTFKLDTEMMMPYFTEGFNQGFDMTSDGDGVDEITDITLILIAYLDNDRELSSIGFDMAFSFVDMGVSYDMSLALQVDIIQTGNVIIEFPRWLDTMTP